MRYIYFQCQSSRIIVQFDRELIHNTSTNGAKQRFSSHWSSLRKGIVSIYTGMSFWHLFIAVILTSLCIAVILTSCIAVILTSLCMQSLWHLFLCSQFYILLKRYCVCNTFWNILERYCYCHVCHFDIVIVHENISDYKTSLFK